MTTQHFYPASEGRFYECVLCKEAIYNPLCQSCLAVQTNKWVSKYPSLSRKLKSKLNKFLIKVEDSTDDALRCVACNKKKAAVCPFCFTEFVLGQLKKLQANPQILGEFLMFFNFDYDGTGYTSQNEIKQLGLGL